MVLFDNAADEEPDTSCGGAKTCPSSSENTFHVIGVGVTWFMDPPNGKKMGEIGYSV